MQPKARNKEYMQLCWVVPNLEAAIDHWVRTTGAGPFFVFEDVHFTDSTYRGQPADIPPHRAAIGQFGEQQIELICPIGDAPGIWNEVVPAGGFGFHHTAIYCTHYDDQKAAYVAEGAEVVFEGLMMGAKTCYVDTMESLGFMTELITANPVAEMVFGEFRKAAEGWDGSDPIRRLG